MTAYQIELSRRGFFTLQVDVALVYEAGTSMMHHLVPAARIFSKNCDFGPWRQDFDNPRRPTRAFSEIDLAGCAADLTGFAGDNRNQKQQGNNSNHRR